MSEDTSTGRGAPAVAPDDPQSFNHCFADVNGIRMHYVDEGHGPLVLLLHGYPFLWYLWRNQIRAVAASGYRVVAPDQRGYGQTEAPDAVAAYDITHLVGDVVGLMSALGEKSAVLVGQDWGSPVVFNAVLMRPDLFRGVLMMCSPPQARGPVPPLATMRAALDQKGLDFYQEYLGRPEIAQEIMRDLRSFLLGIFYSTSGCCPDDEQWRSMWTKDEKFFDTFTVPQTLPSYLSRQALDYYVNEFSRNGIGPANKWYAAIDRGWEVTSFLDGATVKLPALFLTGERDPSLKPLFGIDRQGPAFESLTVNFPNMREIITMPGVGHTPPEEKPDDINEILLRFLNDIEVSARQPN
ncbi:alpha/beta fold hydrolase [Mycobacterium sp. E787]|uniref:alpha/beta fold hydrolase n=1 Tax=Mycobacterium sp. E787 TaxID=1834150 RepID=UPI0018D352B6|nr:alpha/beta hydrolase [Mycobacterium sp. E787]